MHNTKCIMVIDDLMFYDYITTVYKNGKSNIMEGLWLSRYYIIFMSSSIFLMQNPTSQAGIVFTVRAGAL